MNKASKTNEKPNKTNLWHQNSNKTNEKTKKTKKTNFRRLWLENGPSNNCFFWFFDWFYKLILVS